MNCEAVVKGSALGFIVAGLSMTIACTTTQRAEAPEQPPVTVRTASVDVVDFAVPFEAGGVVRARATAQVASRLLAPIVDVHARAGDRVRRGAVLVTLDSREMLAERTRASAGSTSAAESARAAEADVRASESALVLARAMYERMNGLHAKRSATSQELDQAVAALATAEAQLSAARARLASARAASEGAQAANESAQIGVTYSSLSAPFDGIVTERHADPGSMAVPGVALLTIEDTAAFRLEVQVDEARAAAIRPDQTVTVRFDHIPGGDRMGQRPRRRNRPCRRRGPQLSRQDRPAGVPARAVRIIRTRTLRRAGESNAHCSGVGAAGARPAVVCVPRRRRARAAASDVRRRPPPRPCGGSGRSSRTRSRGPESAGVVIGWRSRQGSGTMTRPTGAAGRLAAAFIHSKLTPLVIVASLLLGVYAVIALPREEEPQIIVPMIDVFVDDARRAAAGSRTARHATRRAAALGSAGGRVLSTPRRAAAAR